MTSFEERMASLRSLFIDQAATQAAQLRAALRDGDRARLREVSHSLSGRAGMFGFPEVGQAAQTLEESVDNGVDDLAAPAQSLILLLDHMLSDH